MKLLRIFIIILIAMPTCKAMEKTYKTNELAATKGMHSAQYLTDNSVVMAGNDGCYIALDNTAFRISSTSCKYISISRNNKKIGYYNDTGMHKYRYKNIGIHNTITKVTTDLPIKNSRHIIDFAFDPYDDDTLFILNKTKSQHTIIKCNYSIITTQKISKKIDECLCFDMCPNKKRICIPQHQYLKIYNSDNLKPIQKIKLPSGKIHCCKYNPNGSTIAMYQWNNDFRKCGILIIKPDTNTSHNPLIQYEPPRKMAFYSNHILAILLNRSFIKPCSVHYLNIKTQQLINATSVDFYNCGDISFSPDGKKARVSLIPSFENNKCIIIEVPFEVIFEAKKEEMIFIYWFLKNYQCNQQKLPFDQHKIPVDIIQLIITTLYNILRYETETLKAS